MRASAGAAAVAPVVPARVAAGGVLAAAGPAGAELATEVALPGDGGVKGPRFVFVPDQRGSV